MEGSIETYGSDFRDPTAPLEKLEHIADACLQSTEQDLVDLFARLRQLPEVPLHGPVFHGLVAGIIVAAYRNCGGQATEEDVLKAIIRANAIPGRACGHLGICGAAAAVGAAFAAILDATPLRAELRQQVQQAVVDVAQSIASQRSPRCCQRESLLALKKAAELSARCLPVRLTADAAFRCEQSEFCTECAQTNCPFYGGAAS